MAETLLVMLLRVCYGKLLQTYQPAAIRSSCPECADLGCGAVSAIIERQLDVIVWHSFGFETNYAPDQLALASFDQIREFAFRADLYGALFRPYLR